jgi:hypothetical protein
MTVMAASSAIEGVGLAGDIPPLSADMWNFVAEATACPSPVYFSNQQHGSNT